MAWDAKGAPVGNVEAQFGVRSVWLDVVRVQTPADRSTLLTCESVPRENGGAPLAILRRSMLLAIPLVVRARLPTALLPKLRRLDARS